MQRILRTMMFLKNNIRLSFSFILFVGLSLIFCLMFKYMYIFTTLCILAFGKYINKLFMYILFLFLVSFHEILATINSMIILKELYERKI